MKDVKLGKSVDGVVFEFGLEDSEIEWKEIPEFSLYLVSNTGLVVMRHRKNKVLHLSKSKTTKGTYLTVTIVGDEVERSTVGVHRLVALAFHGLPGVELGLSPEVNHEDGNKHNNLPHNLTWMTRSQNLYHAVEEGLRYDTIRITVVDHLEETEKLYHAITVVARHFNKPSFEMSKIISRHDEKPWEGRYTFIKDDEGFAGKVKHNTVYFKAKNYSTGEILLLDSATTGMDLTKVFSRTISWKLREKNTGLINGFVFMAANDDRDFPEYSEQEVLESIVIHETRPASKAKRFGVVGKDYTSGEIVEFDTLILADKILGFSKGTVRYLLNRDSSRLFKGWLFQYRQELTNWPDFDKEYVEVSVRIKKPEFPPVYVTDLETDTTKLYASLKEFAEQNGVWATNVSSHLRLKPDEAYKKRWMFKFFDLK